MAAHPERIGSYPIERELGRGGMGVVYLATDTRLHRAVAIKVLPELFAQDPERLARFEREARLLASLHHPNIAGIYGLEETEGQRFLVLEYVEGETLAERIGRSRIPLDDVLQIGRQMAAALEAAHESGVIHRDLKPGNVKLKPNGEVKVLDFGLAKGAGAVESTPNMTQSPTIAYAPTGIGVILGTAAYMSPEQARGKPVDRRTDIWSFGCVLYEMLTSRQLFSGETVSDTIAKILEREPDWNALPGDTPPKVRELLQRCLDKDSKQRLRDIGDARIQLGEVLGARTSSIRTTTESASGTPAAPRRGPGLAVAWLVAAASLAVAMLSIMVPMAFKKPERGVARFSIEAPSGLTLAEDAVECALSPDGRSLVFVAADSTGTARLCLRLLEALEAAPVPGTEGATLPFWSKDSRTLGFFADGKLKKVAASGGGVEILCDAKNPRGATWSRDDVILLAPDGAGALYQILGSGGELKQVTVLDSSRRETAHRFPMFLPDGKHFLFTALPARNGKYDIWLASLDSRERKVLMSTSVSPTFVAPGYLVFLRGQGYVAQKLDLRAERLTGTPIVLSDAPGVSSSDGYRSLSASDAGDVAYIQARTQNTELVWMDRAGRRVGKIPIPAGHYDIAAPSPDGRFAAVVRVESPTESEIWIVDLLRSVTTRFTFGGRNEFPIWSPDGRRIVYQSHRDGPSDLFMKAADGSGLDSTFYTSAVDIKNVYAWSEDGRWITFEQLDAATGWDVYAKPSDGLGPAIPYLRTPFNDRFGSISPDGRWMLYSSDESGQLEVYVQSFPQPGNKYRISTSGGMIPLWRADGREILFLSPDLQTLFTTEVSTSSSFQATTPRPLFRLPRGAVIPWPSADFQRILVPLAAGNDGAATMTVATNWAAGLPKR